MTLTHCRSCRYWGRGELGLCSHTNIQTQIHTYAHTPRRQSLAYTNEHTRTHTHTNIFAQTYADKHIVSYDAVGGGGELLGESWGTHTNTNKHTQIDRHTHIHS